MSITRRLLKPELLPQTLWDSTTGTLVIPPILSRAYQTIICRHNLEELAKDRDKNNPPIGGLNQAKTDLHFAQAFDGSVARTQLALLDPYNHVAHVSNAFISRFAGNSLSLTDAPCGAGAAAFSFLASIAELRAQKVLPRLPLHAVLIGAELSQPARAYAKELFMEIRPALEEQAIFVKLELMEWDVTNTLSNTDLIQSMTRSADGKKNRLIVVANFNGFLEKERKRHEAAPRLEELFRHASGENSMAIWIEPDMNRATENGGLFQWLRKSTKQAWRNFVREHLGGGEPEQIYRSSAKFHLPLLPGETADVRLAVMSLVLERSI